MTDDELPEPVVIQGRIWSEDDELGDIPEADMIGDQDGGEAL